MTELWLAIHTSIYRVAQKSKPLPNDKNCVKSPVDVIKFIPQIKVWIKHHNIIRRY